MSLLEEASNSNRDRPASKVLDAEVLAQGRAEQVKAKVRLREVGQTRVQLTSLELAPGTAGTLHELTDLGLRPPQPTAPLSEAAVAHVPANALCLDTDKVLNALRTAGRGSAQDLAGTRYKHFRVYSRTLCQAKSDRVCGLGG